ncbi:DUF6080 domain-containing protein [Prevotella cerevisiae]|jgi:hypothetical protein|uniref:DUF6080 domain-containing protein n=1 Tax=Segatella cerevisiae TaxID=2053716 RepID=A0ABT1BVZ3_9BACT|nr:DUF6080 domain-containing protein [Segatella cerevisiae]MCH3995200.1 DUF6080 domain-containing protein [Prevotella sp.]MCO6025253.1 DUF6080 domain-containing protein [Segatella cerevisiae]
MKTILNIFRIRREERGLAVIAFIFFLLLNALTIYRYYGVFTPIRPDYWHLFIGRFHVSGFDPIAYDVVSHWEARFNVYRHPFLAFLMYVPYLVNRGLIALTGINCAQFVVAAMVIFCAFYSVVFIYRIFREVIDLERPESVLLTGLLFSFAYVMLSCMVPDHFVFSLFALLLTLYVSGRLIKSGKPMKMWHTILLFLLTGGVSLNNGLKVFLSGLFVNGKKFFRWNYFCFAVIVPALLIWVFCRFEYRYFVWPTETARHAAMAKKKAEKVRKDSIARLAMANEQKVQARPIVKRTDSAPALRKMHKVPQKKIHRQIQGAPISHGEFMRWTDVTTNRWQSIVENLFGESIQLHHSHLLEDEFIKRPIIVHYQWKYHYAVESLLVLLFLGGIWCGRHSLFLWLSMSWFGLDLMLHVGLGFGISEVYLMSAHWIFVIPIAIGFLMKAAKSRPPKIRWSLFGLVSALTVYLFIYNGTLIAQYMLS